MGAFALPGLATQPVSGAGNDLTAYQRSLTNNTGVAGQGLLQQGTDQVKQALGYWGPILSGNRAEMTAALAPEINTINSGYDQQKSQLDQFAPRGGGRANLMQQLPFQQTRDISTLFSNLRPQAAQQVAGIGESQQGLGSNLLQSALQAILQKMGINVTESGQNKALAGQLGSAAMGGASAGLSASMGSDYRIKENIRRVGQIGPLNVYSYNFIGSKKRELGFIAQEVHEVFPHAVIVGDRSNPWKVRYDLAIASALRSEHV